MSTATGPSRSRIVRETERIAPLWAWALLGVLLLGNLALAAYGAVSRRRASAFRHRAATDPLTGLPNRGFLHQTLTNMAAHAQRTGRPFAAVLFDLDHFKQIHDRLGHAAGDVVLADVSRVASRLLRASDIVGRYGGEEFLLLLPETDREGAVVAAEHLRHAIGEIVPPRAEHGVTASLGVAVFPADASSADELIACADAALYAAKEGGRNRVEVHAAPVDVDVGVGVGA